MTPKRLRHILAECFERADLPPSAALHVEAVRNGDNINAGIRAALEAMEQAIKEDRATRGRDPELTEKKGDEK